MNSGSRRDRADRLRSIPLERVLRISGAQPDQFDPCKWHTSQGVLSVKGAKFINWKQGVGGGGAIDLAMHLHRLNFAEALEWLEGLFPTLPPPELNPALQDTELKLPLPDLGHLARVEEYLSRRRGLPLERLQSLFHCGDLYADSKANAVFLLRGAHRQPVGAELRGTTTSDWRGMAPGSRKDFGYFSVPSTNPYPVRAIILCESAIDAISCFVLHPDCRCLSTAGARPDPRWLRDLVGQAIPIYCGFDADATGETMARSMMSLHPSIRRLLPQLNDWNDVLKARF